MTKKLLLFIIISSTLFSYEIRLDKSSNEKEKFSEEKSYIALERDDSKEIVFDKNTGLTWQDNIDAKSIKKSRKGAKEYCRRLVFGGYDDWYLPSIKQLKSIVDTTKYNPAIRDGFKNVQAYHYWSSSPKLSANIVNVLNIDFKSGHKYSNNRKGRCNVRCVRGKYRF
ncbi:MAG: DUF1566 domain-containing protein [Campylobacterota bacterium]